jgi:hypothetical protein
MNKDQKDEITKLFIKQYQIINEINQNLDYDLYLCFEGEKEIEYLKKKSINIKKIKNELIKIYSSIISEL